MPTAHTRFSYKYEELSDDAKQTAVETIAGKLAGDWWDENDIERVSETILYKLAEIFRSPGWDTFGAGDFPGITGVTLDGWDLERGAHVLVRGHLDRDNAPGLPWTDSVGGVTLTSHNYGTTVDAEEGDFGFVCTSCGQDAVLDTNVGDGEPHHVIHVSGGTADDDVADADHTPILMDGLPNRAALCQAFEETVKDALNAALKAGQDEAEYIGSQEYALEHIEANDPDFNEDGSLF